MGNKMTDKQNLMFMNNKERLDAEKKLKDALENVRNIQPLSAQTILICMPPALKKLNQAYDNLIAVEARIEDEILNKTER